MIALVPMAVRQRVMQWLLNTAAGMDTDDLGPEALSKNEYDAA